MAPRAFASRLQASSAGHSAQVGYTIDINLVTQQQATEIETQVEALTRTLRQAGITDYTQLRNSVQNYVDEMVARYSEDITPVVSSDEEAFSLPRGMELDEVPDDILD